MGTQKCTIAAALCLTLLSGCASMSNRSKTLVAMGVAGIAAGTLGAMSAPAGEQPIAHAALWGGGAAAIVGVTGLFIFDEQARSREYERQLNVAKQEIDAIRWGAGANEEKLIFESSGTQDKAIPDELKKLLSPGWVRVYQTSMWVKQGDDSLVHQDKIVRIKKPQLIPNNDSNEGGERK
ncbi:MAG: hypothetical protein A2428_11810 [Bdellovibrionales bacterium RIFOXYC1_FULL_54_43]|nr:MAG: hypothetical protein A2428_11810 [Bdellovibrionales bacterium RIFOXYC1_FULL_54_43]OFZ81080.1 MAG: hypothetical protein A2603_05935 [Bdellovibrionales bacterium RIFOXYD1_FULL_55_31]